MAATLADITIAANDGYLQDRVAACAATRDIVDPVAWADAHKWEIVTFTAGAPDERIADSYQYAEATKTINQQEHTGKRTDTILDSVIEAAVDAIIAAETPAES